MMDTIRETLLSIFNDSAESIASYWTIFQVVSIAMLGFIFKESHVRTSAGLMTMLTIVYLFFSVSNMIAMDRPRTLLHAASVELQKYADSGPPSTPRVGPVLRKHTAVEPWTALHGHCWMTFFVAALAWAPFIVNRSRQRAEPSEGG